MVLPTDETGEFQRSQLRGIARHVALDGPRYHVQLRHASDSRSLLRATKGFETKALGWDAPAGMYEAYFNSGHMSCK